MIINNEFLNQLIRDGESQLTFSLHPTIENLVDSSGELKHKSGRVPLLDAMRSVIAWGQSLLGAGFHPRDMSGLSISSAAWQNVLLTLERGTPPQDDLFERSRQVIKKEISSARQAHEVAREILDAASNPNSKLKMETLVRLLSKSENKALSLNMLASAGRGHAGWMSPSGTLAPLTQEVPQTLPAGRPLRLVCHVCDVNDQDGIAKVEVIAYQDRYTQEMLEYSPSRISLHFDAEKIERDDLLAIQYHSRPVGMVVSASCATGPTFSRRTSLTLSLIQMSRQALDKWHTSARQTELPFERAEPD
jgi:hypothetical protein